MSFTDIVIIFVIVSFAVLGPWIAPYTFEEANGVLPNSWNPPSQEHLLGTTLFGRDILSRLIYGARSSLTIAFPAISFSVVLGIILGVIVSFFKYLYWLICCGGFFKISGQFLKDISPWGYIVLSVFIAWILRRVRKKRARKKETAVTAGKDL